jgi:hypothetical protein
MRSDNERHRPPQPRVLGRPLKLRSDLEDVRLRHATDRILALSVARRLVVGTVVVRVSPANHHLDRTANEGPSLPQGLLHPRRELEMQMSRSMQPNAPYVTFH